MVIHDIIGDQLNVGLEEEAGLYFVGAGVQVGGKGESYTHLPHVDFHGDIHARGKLVPCFLLFVLAVFAVTVVYATTTVIINTVGFFRALFIFLCSSI